MKTEVSNEERKVITTQDTQQYNQTVRDPLSEKLLLCILETLQDIKQEITQLRQSNEQMRHRFESILAGTSVKVQNQN